MPIAFSSSATATTSIASPTAWRAILMTRRKSFRRLFCAAIKKSNRLPKAGKRQKQWGWNEGSGVCTCKLLKGKRQMEHPKEEELIAFNDSRERQSPDWRRFSDHLNSCAECRAALEKIEAVFAAMD